MDPNLKKKIQEYSPQWLRDMAYGDHFQVLLYDAVDNLIDVAQKLKSIKN